MNNFILQGKILYKEAPKRTGGSALIMLLVGRDKEEGDNLIQSVNKVIVRVPGRLAQVLDRFEIDEYIEMSGTMIGRVYSPIGSKKKIATINLVASGIHACSVSHLVKENEIEKSLFGQFTMSGLVKAVTAPKKEGRPHTLYLQVERPITRNEDSEEQPTATIPIAVYDARDLQKLEAQMSIVVNGRLHGLLRKMPIAGVMDEFEERLEVGLVSDRVRQCAIIPTKLFESRQERSKRLIREKQEGSKDVVIIEDEENGDEILIEEDEDVSAS